MNKNKVNFVIDGTQVPYKITNSADYFLLHDHLSQREVDSLFDNNYGLCQTVSQIIGLKISVFLLWNTTHLCQSSHDSLLILKKSLIKELKLKYNYIFDEAWFDNNVKRNE